MIINEVISPTGNAFRHYREVGMPPPTEQELRKLMPRLNRWSDVVWLLWARKAEDQAGNLRYILRDNITNKGTKAVMDQVFKVPENSLDLKWPGKTFDVREGDEGKALLGTPQGSGIAWVLADNKQILGERSLKVTCFTGESSTGGANKYYYLLFELIRV